MSTSAAAGETRVDATVESALRDAFDRYGPSLIFEPTLLRTLLERRCPHALHDVASVMKAVDAQIPQALVSTRDGEKLRQLVRALEKKLRDRHALNRYAAAWAVRTWVDALGLTVTATETSDEPASRTTEATGLRDRPASISPPGREDTTSSPEPQTTMASMASTASSSAHARPSSADRSPLRHPWLRAALALGFIAAAAALLRYVESPPAGDERPSSAAHREGPRGDQPGRRDRAVPRPTFERMNDGANPGAVGAPVVPRVTRPVEHRERLASNRPGVR